MIGGDVIGSLGSENEEAVATDGVLVDALVARAANSPLTQAAHPSADVVFYRGRDLQTGLFHLARRVPPLSRGPPVVPSARAIMHRIQVFEC